MMKITHPGGDFIEVHGPLEFQEECIKKFEQARKELADKQKEAQRESLIAALRSKLLAKREEELGIRAEIRRIENQINMLR